MKEVVIDNERIYLKKDSLGWRIINPTKIDGKTNYCNLLFGGKRNIVLLIIILVIVGSFLLAYGELSSQFNDIIANPCNYSYFENFTGCFHRVGGDIHGAINFSSA